MVSPELVLHFNELPFFLSELPTSVGDSGVESIRSADVLADTFHSALSVYSVSSQDHGKHGQRASSRALWLPLSLSLPNLNHSSLLGASIDVIVQPKDGVCIDSAQTDPLHDSFTMCQVCFQLVGVSDSSECGECGLIVCQECIVSYIRERVTLGLVSNIQCLDSTCEREIPSDAIRTILAVNSHDILERYNRFLEAREDHANDTKKSCPFCSQEKVLILPKSGKLFSKRKDVYKVTCESCSKDWCFQCHAPWHEEMSCKQYKTGNKLFKSWIRGKNVNGSANGQHCPGCRIPIERTSGCNNMHCSKCKTRFCYGCGETFASSIIFGKHHKTLTPNGCKGRYKGKRGTRQLAVYGLLGAEFSVGMAYPVLYIPFITVAGIAYATYRAGRALKRKLK